MIDANTLRLVEAIANKRLPWSTEDRIPSRFNSRMLDDFTDLVTLHIVMPFDLDMYVQCFKKSYAVDDWIESAIRNWYTQHRPHEYFHDLTLKDPARWQEWLQQVDRVLMLNQWCPKKRCLLRPFDSSRYNES